MASVTVERGSQATQIFGQTERRRRRRDERGQGCDGDDSK